MFVRFSGLVFGKRYDFSFIIIKIMPEIYFISLNDVTIHVLFTNRQMT